MNYWYHLFIGLFAFLFRDAAGKITSGHWHPSAPAPSPSALLCSFITSQDFNIRLTFQFLVQAATGRVWVAQEREAFLESCPRREGEL